MIALANLGYEFGQLSSRRPDARAPLGPVCHEGAHDLPLRGGNVDSQLVMTRRLLSYCPRALPPVGSDALVAGQGSHLAVPQGEPRANLGQDGENGQPSG